MKILHTIQGLDVLSGGPSTCTKDLMEGLRQQEVEVELFTLKCNNPNSYNLGEGSGWLIEAPCDYYSPLFISKNFHSFLLNSEYDLYHTNGLWMYANHITCKIARKKKKPYIVSPHGMLYANALKIKTWRKKIMLKVWFDEDVKKADCLHVTCNKEMEHCRKYGYKGPIAVIPNPVVFPPGVNIKNLDFETSDGTPTIKKIGVLARLNPIKKIENLLQAASIVVNKGVAPFDILIMGSGNKDYEVFLKKEAAKLGISSHVHFLGFVDGREKYDRLACLRALFVPSESENFGMIVPEALICGTPVYASLGTPWGELNEYNAGWWRDNSPESIAKVIEDVLTMSTDQLITMGRNGRALMEEKYKQEIVAKQMSELYYWILNKNKINKPTFVYE